jgi:hypothetical protein
MITDEHEHAESEPFGLMDPSNLAFSLPLAEARGLAMTVMAGPCV